VDDPSIVFTLDGQNAGRLAGEVLPVGPASTPKASVDPAFPPGQTGAEREGRNVYVLAMRDGDGKLAA
jgi:hypothetical protein